MTVSHKSSLKIEPCHPRLNLTDCTCYSNEQLNKIADALRYHGHHVQPSSDRKQLWRNIDKVMRSEYGSKFDWAWLSTAPVKPIADHEMLKKTFRPKAPDNWTLHVETPNSTKGGKYVWLSNFDIDAVLAQYEDLEHLQDFKFYKSASIDFEDTHDPVSKINIWQLQKKGINRVGIVFNLDKHNEPGSHWISMFINIPQKLICFFDSYGRLPESQFQDFMAKICIQALLGFDGKSLDPSKGFDMIPLYNATRFQRSGSECGVYSIYAIVTLLQGLGSAIDFENMCRNIRDDETMNSFRKRLFIDRGK